MAITKKVSEYEFVQYFDQYNQYVDDYTTEINSNIDVIEKAIEYYQLEKSYSIDLSYSIVQEALKHKIKNFSDQQLQNIIMLIAPSINIPPVEWCPYNISFSENWMILSKFLYIENIFSKDDLWWNFQLSAFNTANRLISLILISPRIDSFLKLMHENISLEEKSTFIKDHYWLFDKHPQYNWSDSRKIRLYRKLKSQLSAYFK